MIKYQVCFSGGMREQIKYLFNKLFKRREISRRFCHIMDEKCLIFLVMKFIMHFFEMFVGQIGVDLGSSD